MLDCRFSSKVFLFLTSFLCCWCWSNTLHSQEKPIERQLVDQLHSKSNKLATDLIYLQTSKDIYETEEDLWFKGYVLNAKKLNPSLLNKILYIQLINDTTNQPVWEEKYEIVNGFVDGHIYLDHSLKEGSYTIYAYSANSVNGISKDFQAMRNVEILKNISNNAYSKRKRNDSIQFNVFPEGGYLVSGIAGYVAFKATDSRGFPVKVSGSVYENDQQLLDFKSEHAGMGRFKITPDAKNKYYIKLSETSEQADLYLPEIMPSGKTLQLLSNTNEVLQFKVSKSDTSKEKVYLRVQMNGTVFMIVHAKLTSEIIIKIPLDDLPRGIAEITLFDKNIKPLAERLVFVNQDQKLNIHASLDKSLYQTREKAILKIKTTDQHNKPVVGHLGLSVYDKLYENDQGSKTIESHYLLSSKLKGKLYNPTYYFDSINKDRKRDLDLLLSTQGWRRYLWTETNLDVQLDSKKQLFINDNIGGRIVSKRRRKKHAITPKTHAVMTFSGNNEDEKEFVFTDSLGRFDITPRHLRISDDSYLYVKALNDPEREFKLSIGDYRFNNINKWRTTIKKHYPIFENFVPPQKKTKAFNLKSDVNQLSEVNIKGKVRKPFRDKYLSTLNDLIAGRGNYTDYVCDYNILNCANHVTGRPPVVGEVLRERQRGFLVNIVYAKRKYSESELLEKFNLVMIKGFYGKREFYQPKHDENTDIKDPFPDTRNTLLWKPDVITNENGEAVIEFFCSDLNTIFVGNIEGVGDRGLIGSKRFKFVVKNLE